MSCQFGHKVATMRIIFTAGMVEIHVHKITFNVSLTCPSGKGRD